MSTIKERELELEKELECSLCKDVYKEPKTFECLHSFCLECLGIYVERNHSNVELTCPICRTPLPQQLKQKQQQLSDLPTDSFLLDTLNTYNSLKNATPQHKNKKQKLMCSEEEGNEATYYCWDCDEFLCEVCANAHKSRGRNSSQSDKFHF